MKAKISKITATSRASVKIHDNFFTVEYSEERTLPDTDLSDDEIVVERNLLWDDVNATVDEQVEEICRTFKK